MIENTRVYMNLGYMYINIYTLQIKTRHLCKFTYIDSTDCTINSTKLSSHLRQCFMQMTFRMLIANNNPKKKFCIIHDKSAGTRRNLNPFQFSTQDFRALHLYYNYISVHCIYINIFSCIILKKKNHCYCILDVTATKFY